MRAFAQKRKATKQTTSAKSTIPSRAHSGQGGVVNSILHLQRAIGNQAVQRLLEAHTVNVEADSTNTKIARFGHDFSRIPIHPPASGAIQTKISINQPGDVYEQEADRIADQMATPAHSAVSGAPPRIQRFSGQSDGQMDAAPASVDQALASPGRPLEPALRQDMEQRFGFGHDFSRVRVHSGAAAEQSARDVNARAFTVGGNVVFGRGEYAPDTTRGYHLIAHELTHVVQQSNSAASLIQLMPLDLYSDPDPLHDPSRLTDQEIEATDEYADYMAMQPTPPFNQRVLPEEARLACRLLLRYMRDRGMSLVTTNAVLLTWLDRARARLGVTTNAEGAVGKQVWVPSGSGDINKPATAASEFTRWMLAGGNQPDPATGRLNCYEMVLFSAFRTGNLSEATMRGIYTRSKAAMTVAGGGMEFPRTLERELRSSNEYIYDPADPNTPRPLRGDFVIFKEAANHVALATGRRVSGGIEIVSHWPPPDGSHHVKLTTIEALLPEVGVQVAKFWSPIW